MMNRHHFIRRDGKVVGFKKRTCQISDNNGHTVASVGIGVSQWTWSKNESTFIIKLIPSNDEITIRLISFRKGFWKFDYQGNHYEFYRHKGHKKSLYSSGEVVAQFDKRRVNAGYSDRATIISNNNEDPIILLSLFLIYDIHDDRGAELTIDFGHFTKGLRESDQSWKPIE